MSPPEPHGVRPRDARGNGTRARRGKEHAWARTAKPHRAQIIAHSRAQSRERARGLHRAKAARVVWRPLDRERIANAWRNRRPGVADARWSVCRHGAGSTAV
ncbi:hypothetical protein MB84_27770 (plasmid) [Pandoraea oxalativorans]|uniref:Uncharacterized protein n=1 Tax=Pandoraea oxalativorans TaxID=573737 RepID=A0A0G3IHJ7_9BURK|nr:hypothetical protein MB84_27770 [Pandoraea oxalativorans]